MKKLSIILLSLLISTQSFAESDMNDPYFDISRIDVEVQELSDRASLASATPDKKIKDILKTIDDIVIVGKKVYDIIKKGKPVTNISIDQTVDALPVRDGKSIDVGELENWSLPVSKSFRISYKNGYGKEVIGFTYIVTMQYGGSFEGSGQYLSQVSVKAEDVSVAWGYKFDASTQFMSAVNHGSKADPEMGLTFDITFKVENTLKSLMSTRTFHVTGGGDIISLN